MDTKVEAEREQTQMGQDVWSALGEGRVSLEEAKGALLTAFPLSLKETRLLEGGTWFYLSLASS